MSQVIVPPPYLFQFPRFFNGEITLGAMTQSASAFGNIVDGLSSSGTRTIVRQLSRGDHPARWPDHRQRRRQGAAGDHHDAVRRRHGAAHPVEVRTPDGTQLVSPLDLRLEVGDTMVVTGDRASERPRCCAASPSYGLTSGTLTRPCGPNETMFLSQMPYVPLGDLRAVVSYPNEEGDYRRRDAEAHDGEGGAAASRRPARRGAGVRQGVSPGEQQRIAFARVLLTKPKAVFLDESTSALDVGLEYLVYDLVRTEMPDTIKSSSIQRRRSSSAGG